jgi:hypothetical protein
LLWRLVAFTTRLAFCRCSIAGPARLRDPEILWTYGRTFATVRTVRYALMVTLRPPPTTEQMREAIRDLTGILRAMYAAADPHRRAGIVEAGLRLAELDAVLGQEDTEAYGLALRAADVAVNSVLGGLHFNAGLAPVLAHAATRALPTRRR